jgi:drug/metabolite transporter (DMT)-like permease
LRPRDGTELVTLAALWGAAFLFMRVAAPEFGALALAAVRVGGATLLLLPLLAWHGHGGALVRHWKPIAVVGLINSALPFSLYSYAALSISAGLSSIFNATAPLFGAIVAAFWLQERLTLSRVAGLVIGFGGVGWLAWDSAGAKADAIDVPGAVAACLAGAALYGFSASYAKKRLAGVPPMAVATGSQLTATLLLAGPAVALWPADVPSAGAWYAAIALALLCTGIALVLYFRLIAHVGASNAVSVTFLIPAFAVLWGVIFLGETPTVRMLAGCAVILLGTALVTGVLRLPERVAARGLQ